MYKITVTKKGYVTAIYYNKDADIGLSIAKGIHGESHTYRVEAV